jgi:hypothetical protein
MLSNTRWKANTMWHLGTDAMKGYESETMVCLYIGRMQWLYPHVGFDYNYKKLIPMRKISLTAMLKTF